MPDVSHMTITIASDLAASVNDAVAAGDYRSSSEIVEEALLEWEVRRAVEADQLAALRREIDVGLVDIAEGRVHDFDIARIAERGRTLLTDRSRSG